MILVTVGWLKVDVRHMLRLPQNCIGLDSHAHGGQDGSTATAAVLVTFFVCVSNKHIMSLMSSQYLNHLSANAIVNNSVTGKSVNSVTVSGPVLQGSTIVGGLEALTAAGAIDPNVLTTTITAPEPTTEYTLAAGTAGQLKNIVLVAESDEFHRARVFPHAFIGGNGTYFTFNNVGGCATLVYTGAAWALTGAEGVGLLSSP